ncbi:cytochrome c-type biogenesis protein CcmH [Phenylobacterium sp. 20VBR1]|uniref:Cytochrome c-type biogenesis protein n=1 Tax=Phenylobacterium glaciei TaxID=2803784 RepID=A0A941D4R2_9CAUL|nr:cytochrome c-type biogenesis protein [Phenylobacterium glaciei]MBR7620861.1 cytochrome c-type biogenesis protein CcmH [Phenylobacterium glaciei]
MKKLLLLLAAVFCMAAASDPAERLPDPGQEARARAIFAQVRCLVCQNESIDDSQAELAGDLRRLVRDQIAAGKSDGQVKTYLTDRYGEFVLLKPAFSWGNGALWGAPFLVVTLGLLLWLRNLRTPRPDAELSQDEAARVADLADKDQT